MDTKALMSGIAVVIDDRITNGVTPVGDGADPIVGIVERLETEWKLPFYRTNRMPP